ncbi:MAG: hydrogenase iron-sulfur subunit [Magnetococcales bacterium]|nr:hydrogenase iron-sulfur subunit [Magnetococcales bacterium]MBF0150789.1 hydrogenase iron-sulfur subunit [Magnetococcales bacterium]MBF0174002.1 hydrogenase iron-sulfur subunit [Magnetococcales bacterium]MBF0348309.1 hydrogenase iron-sulfur subunit [Magnetococcales bacterium]MBF0631881.1 hydrogenase iron-sulfur subunit [Magnetococcales bacterium]
MGQDDEPKILSFLCNWCSYAAADKAGTAQYEQPHQVRSIRVMCTGRLDPQFVLHAFRQGADGVVILGCHPGDCHYKEGNIHAIKRHRLLLALLRSFGIEEQRCRFEFVAAGESERYVNILTEVVAQIKTLGPMHFPKNRCDL